MRAAVAHERQRNAGHGKEPEIHPDVDDELPHDKDRQAEAIEYLEVRLSVHRRKEYAPDKDAVEAKKDKDADEAPLFRICREDKVSLVFGQELQSRLRAVPDPLSEDLPRPDCDHGLVGVVP